MSCMPCGFEILFEDETCLAVAKPAGLQRVDIVAGLVGHGLESRPSDVRTGYAACQAGDGSPRILIPVGGSKADEGGNEVDAVVITDRGCQSLGLWRAGNDLQPVAQPDFAEGWNKRATVYFLMGDFDQSLADCDETLKRNANHFGALSGCGAIYAQREGSAASVVDEVESDLDLTQLMQVIPRIEDLLETEDDAPIIRMINALLTQASRDGASDIHFEAFESSSVVRFRIDGVLAEMQNPPKKLQSAIISRQIGRAHV